MSDNLLKRLRAPGISTMSVSEGTVLVNEAADRIAALERSNKKLREALQNMAPLSQTALRLLQESEKV